MLHELLYKKAILMFLCMVYVQSFMRLPCCRQQKPAAGSMLAICALMLNTL